MEVSLTDKSEHVLKGHFINRLKLDVKAEARMMKPFGLDRIMEMAQRMDDRNQHLRET